MFSYSFVSRKRQRIDKKMQENTAITGRCLCGEVTFTGRGKVTDIHVCHCRLCARWGGGPAFGLSFSSGTEFSGPVRWYNSSAWAERGFCTNCGSCLFYRLKSGDVFAVSAGAVDDQSVIPPIERHIYVDCKPLYYEFADTAPRLTEEEFLASISQQD